MNYQEIFAKFPANEWERFEKAQIRLFNIVKKIIERHQVKYFMDCGTLLGIIRDDKLIYGDNDMDIAIMFEDVKRSFISDLLELGMIGNNRSNDSYHYSKDEIIAMLNGKEVVSKILCIKNPKMFGSFFGGKYTPTVDVSIFVDNGKNLVCGYGNKRFRFREQSDFTKTKLINCYLGDVSIPENPERWIEVLYGPSWKTPNPGFDENKECNELVKKNGRELYITPAKRTFRFVE